MLQQTSEPVLRRFRKATLSVGIPHCILYTTVFFHLPQGVIVVIGATHFVNDRLRHERGPPTLVRFLENLFDSILEQELVVGSLDTKRGFQHDLDLPWSELRLQRFNGYTSLLAHLGEG